MTASVALIGPGRVGSAIAKFLVAADYRMHAVIGRDPERTLEACDFIGCAPACATTDPGRCATAEIILLAVPDDQITAVINKTAECCALNRKFLVHFSGLLPSSALLNEATQAEKLLSLHPLFPFADRHQAYEKLRGCPCALEGGSSALALGSQLVATFSGAPFVIAAADKPLYHTAASMASNFLVTLLDIAQNLLRQCGIPQERLAATLLPLVRATLDNLEALPPEQGLTGPIVRGDYGTVAQHLDALTINAAKAVPTYLQLARATLELANRSGRLESGKAAELEKLLTCKNT
jgi:predicted short-subunit dehydrogenase-like oxidoreductase (DUF2520 family)